MNQMHYERAISDFDQAISLNPNIGLFYGYRARAYASLGEKKSAWADILKAKNLGHPIPPSLEQWVQK